MELVVELVVPAHWDPEGIAEGRMEAVCERCWEGKTANEGRGEEEAGGDRVEGEDDEEGLSGAYSGARSFYCSYLLAFVLSLFRAQGTRSFCRSVFPLSQSLPVLLCVVLTPPGR